MFSFAEAQKAIQGLATAPALVTPPQAGTSQAAPLMPGSAAPGHAATGTTVFIKPESKSEPEAEPDAGAGSLEGALAGALAGLLALKNGKVCPLTAAPTCACQGLCICELCRLTVVWAHRST